MIISYHEYLNEYEFYGFCYKIVESTQKKRSIKRERVVSPLISFVYNKLFEAYLHKCCTEDKTCGQSMAELFLNNTRKYPQIGHYSTVFYGFFT